jgi:hypothetical protein
MCVTNTPGACKDLFPAKAGEQWFIKGIPYVVGIHNQQYIYGNGNDSEARYVSLTAQDGTPCIITHRKFLELAKREEPSVERFITPDQIMLNKPCEEGAKALFRFLRVAYTGSPYIQGANLAASGKRSLAINIKDLYKAHYDLGYGQMQDSWLLFLAKALNLIPDRSMGVDRATLLRLLGVK